MGFEVTIDQFSGPLDLMLHLIKEEKMDLLNLDIARLTDQYLLYIRTMQDLHLDVASEYLVELATLIEYKSKKLLPNEPEEELEDEYEDESDQLVKRLLEYQKYKEVTEEFESLFNERSLQYDKPVSEITNDWIKVDENFQETSPYELIKAMQKCLKRFQISQPYQVSITTKEITVDDRTKQLKNHIKKWNGTFTLEKSMEDCHDTYMVVVTFLSLLDMVHDGYLNFTIKEETVYFSRGTKDGTD